MKPTLFRLIVIPHLLFHASVGYFLLAPVLLIVIFCKIIASVGVTNQMEQVENKFNLVPLDLSPIFIRIALIDYFSV